MRGDLVYQRVMQGRLIEVLLDEVSRTYDAFLSRWRAWGTTLSCIYRRGRGDSEAMIIALVEEVLHINMRM